MVCRKKLLYAKVALLMGAFLSSCVPIALRIPAVNDERLEALVNREALAIVRVSENAHRASLYDIRLADFPRRDVLGLSVGGHRIFVSYELAQLAARSDHHHWLLRQTLAHEIAHDVLGGDTGQSPRPRAGQANRVVARDLGLSGLVSFRPFSSSAELKADRKGLEYWRRLGWDCRQWVRIFRRFVRQGYHGDADHPTAERLHQALRLCPEGQTPVEILSFQTTRPLVRPPDRGSAGESAAVYAA